MEVMHNMSDMQWVVHKKRDVVLKRLTDQQEELVMLERNKKEMMNDYSARYQTRYNNRKHLESEWQKATELKRKKARM